MVGWGGALVYAADPPLPATTFDGVPWIAISSATPLVCLDPNRIAYLNNHRAFIQSVNRRTASPWGQWGNAICWSF